jgi:Uma2 family endonuclease
MPQSAAKPPHMTVDEFMVWAQDQPGRHELYDGEVFTMQAEREAHTTVKLSVAIALRNALANKRTGCRAYTDGRSVRIDSTTSFEPDALVECGPRDPRSLYAEQPVIVVEVTSPSTSRIDRALKLFGYMGLPSIRHYLIVDAENRFLIHFRRNGDEVVTRILNSKAGAGGMLHLDPPGITVEIGDFFADLDVPD